VSLLYRVLTRLVDLLFVLPQGLENVLRVNVEGGVTRVLPFWELMCPSTELPIIELLADLPCFFEQLDFSFRQRCYVGLTHKTYIVAGRCHGCLPWTRGLDTLGRDIGLEQLEHGAQDRTVLHGDVPVAGDWLVVTQQAVPVCEVQELQKADV